MIKLILLGLSGLMLALPVAAQAQFTVATNAGALTITGYSGSDEVVAIPGTIDGLPVTSLGNAVFVEKTNLTTCIIPNGITNIGFFAFYSCTSLTDIAIPESLTSIEDGAFSFCTSLTRVSIPQNVTHIGGSTFEFCTSLTNVNLPDNLTSVESHLFSYCTNLNNLIIPASVIGIGDFAFANCFSLTSVIIPGSTTNIGMYAFAWCDRLAAIYFRGAAPTVGEGGFYAHNPFRTLNAYYLPGTTGWGTTLGGRPTVRWFLPNPLILNNNVSFGVQTNGFSFIISWATNASVVVEASPSLTAPMWQPINTNILSNGAAHFTDPQGPTYFSRFYRLRAE